MQIHVTDPAFQTTLFAALLAVALAVSARKTDRSDVLSPSQSQELKGFAILAIMLGHIGYGLSANNAFLFPLSVMAGVGVNIFLFLSGLGLAISAGAAPRSLKDFYIHRFRPLFMTLWLALTAIFAMDFLLLGKTYSLATMVQSYLGWYPSAVMATDVDSPLWYMTFLFAYYLAFPLLYRSRRPYFSAAALFAYGVAFTVLVKPFVGTTVWLYGVHTAAFPLGVLAAHLLPRLRQTAARLRSPSVRLVAAAALAGGVAFAATHAGLMQWYEQPMSLAAMFAVIGIVALLPVRFALLATFGAYSFEMFLLHWPLMYRHDVFYAHLPPFAATAAYLFVLPCLGWALQRLAKGKPFTSTT